MGRPLRIQYLNTCYHTIINAIIRKKNPISESKKVKTEINELFITLNKSQKKTP
jgi:hypothetical protein